MTVDVTVRHGAFTRAYLQGSTYLTVGKEAGITGSRVRQIVTHHLRVLERRAQEHNWAPEIDWSNSFRTYRAKPRQHAALWLRMLDAYEAQRELSKPHDQSPTA